VNAEEEEEIENGMFILEMMEVNFMSEPDTWPL